VLKDDNLTAIYEPTVKKVWEPRRLTTLWASTACYRDSFTFLLLLTVVKVNIRVMVSIRWRFINGEHVVFCGFMNPDLIPFCSN
jgi:hypothetical protein